MVIETALMTYLLAQSGVTDLIAAGADGGKEIHFVQAPQNVNAPYLVVSKISGPRVQSHEANSHLAHPRFQLTAFAATYAAAKGIIAAVQSALQGYAGTMGGAGGVVVSAAFYEDETDLERGDSGLYGVAADYIIWHYD